jgi:hypothetical protein
MIIFPPIFRVIPLEGVIFARIRRDSAWMSSRGSLGRPAGSARGAARGPAITEFGPELMASVLSIGWPSPIAAELRE